MVFPPLYNLLCATVQLVTLGVLTRIPTYPTSPYDPIPQLRVCQRLALLTFLWVIFMIVRGGVGRVRLG